MRAEALRSALTAASRRLAHRLLRRRIDVAIALNPDAALGFAPLKPGMVLQSSNAALDYDSWPAHRSPEPRTVLFAGRGVAWKGLLPLIQAMEHLPGWTLHIAGTGTDARPYREAAKPYRDRVIFHGRLDRDDTLELMNKSAVFALPSLHDSAPWAAAEAAGAGRPVVCLPYGGVSAMAADHAVVADTSAPLPLALAKAVTRAESLSLPAFRGHTSDSLQRTLATAYAIPGIQK
ncbi:glycosyltransferase [Microbacterium album]|nr:glycosyltransferase [Microbacterium album]